MPVPPRLCGFTRRRPRETLCTVEPSSSKHPVNLSVGFPARPAAPHTLLPSSRDAGTLGAHARPPRATRCGSSYLGYLVWSKLLVVFISFFRKEAKAFQGPSLGNSCICRETGCTVNLSDRPHRPFSMHRDGARGPRRLDTSSAAGPALEVAQGDVAPGSNAAEVGGKTEVRLDALHRSALVDGETVREPSRGGFSRFTEV